MDPKLTETSLNRLLANLPSRCVLLLEDIDAAGLGRDESKHSSPSRISLSAVLNAIDGVSSPTGRILVMTTNHVELLDAALVRPGRVDMHIHFKHPSKLDIRNLFLRIYEAPLRTRTVENEPTSNYSAQNDSGEKDSKVDELAEEFSSIIPEDKFSFAAIQGYLLKYKQDARAAVANAAEWIATG